MREAGMRDGRRGVDPTNVWVKRREEALQILRDRVPLAFVDEPSTDGMEAVDADEHEDEDEARDGEDW